MAKKLEVTDETRIVRNPGANDYASPVKPRPPFEDVPAPDLSQTASPDETASAIDSTDGSRIVRYPGANDYESPAKQRPPFEAVPEPDLSQPASADELEHVVNTTSAVELERLARAKREATGDVRNQPPAAPGLTRYLVTDTQASTLSHGLDVFPISDDRTVKLPGEPWVAELLDAGTITVAPAKP